MKSIIPAAGLGTRFLPATKCSPKELLPVLDKPVIQYVVEEALEPEGVDAVVIVNSHEKPQIESYFAEDAAFEDMLRSRGKEALADAVHEAGALPVSFVYQDDPKGLGHAVYCAKDEMDGDPFFVLLGDYFVPDRKMCVNMQKVSQAHGGASVIANGVYCYDSGGGKPHGHANNLNTTVKRIVNGRPYPILIGSYGWTTASQLQITG